MVYSQQASTLLTSKLEIVFRIQTIIQRAVEINPNIRNNSELKQELSAIQELQIRGIKDALTESVYDISRDLYTVPPDQDQLHLDLLRDLDELKQVSPQEFTKKARRFLDYLKEFWSASATESRLAWLQHISQMISIASDETIKKLAEAILSQPDPRLKGEICYALGLSGRYQYLPLVRHFLEDPDPWVREQASRAVRRLEALEYRQIPKVVDEATAQVLDKLLDFIGGTRERFYNENRRYQLLARIRKTLREHLFERLPTDSRERSLVTAIINATNRTTAKNFRVKYLDIFKDSLEALREGHTNGENIELLERRLLEIDDES